MRLTNTPIFFIIRTIILSLSLLPSLAFAQDILPFAWQSGDLALSYPAGWSEPLELDGRLVLRAAGIAVPDAPTITIIREPGTSTDLYGALQLALQDVSIIASGPLDGELAGFPGVATSGRSADGSTFGIGRATTLPDATTLIIVGIAPNAERDSFTATFNAVADSVVLGAGSTPSASTEYGVLWYSNNDGDFAQLTGLVYRDQRLYTVDSELGIVQMDATTGEVLNTFTVDAFTDPTDLAVDDLGTLYVADLACACVVIVTPDGTQNGTLDGFGSGQPRSIAVTASGQLYATDADTIRADIQTVPSPDASTLLAVDAQGRIMALTPDGTILVLNSNQFSFDVQIDNLPVVNDFAVDANGNFVFATASQGIVVYDTNGRQLERLGRVVPSFPLPGELVAPTHVAVGSDGTIFWVDSGAITAMSTSVVSGQSGSGTLILGTAVQGALTEFTPQQTWTFAATAGQVITISAIDSDDAGLDVALRLLAPSGIEEAFNDDHANGDLPDATDAQILVHTIQSTGTYFVIVEQVSGEGAYKLGIAEAIQPFEFAADSATTLQGELQDVFPVQRWSFDGRAGQVLTITMLAEDGSLDPLLRLRDSAGEVIAENDDAFDAALGTNAQLFQVTLPADGSYVLEAVRFDGVGRYQIIIVVMP